MNYKMYDPSIGIMLGPDNFVSQPFNTQNYNRYSYALKNPLLFTDPTGNNPAPPPQEDDEYWRTGGGFKFYSFYYTNDIGRWYPGYSSSVGLNFSDLFTYRSDLGTWVKTSDLAYFSGPNVYNDVLSYAGNKAELFFNAIVQVFLYLWYGKLIYK